MIITLNQGPLNGTLRVPPSKSITHRLLIAAALAEGTSVIDNVDFSNDVDATMRCLRMLGATIVFENRTTTVTGIDVKNTPKHIRPIMFDCGESGSTLRFLIPVVAALGVETDFDGWGQLPRRPITAYLRELPEKGVNLRRYDENSLPLIVSGKLTAGTFHLEGDISSQYVTGLLLALPLLEGDSDIVLTSPLESRPYVDITIDVLKQFGITIETTPTGFHIKGGQKFIPCNTRVEGDYSQAAFFFVANALGSHVTFEDLNPQSYQGDRQIVSIVEEFVHKRDNGEPVFFDIDAHDIPDLVPILAVLGTFGTEISHITHAHRLTLKESNRLETTASMINDLGGHVVPNPDGLDIYPVQNPTGGRTDSCNDHRIAMSAAIFATRCTEFVTIYQAHCVEKSYPDFFRDFSKLGGNIHGILLES